MPSHARKDQFTQCQYWACRDDQRPKVPQQQQALCVNPARNFISACKGLVKVTKRTSHMQYRNQHATACSAAICHSMHATPCSAGNGLAEVTKRTSHMQCRNQYATACGAATCHSVHATPCSAGNGLVEVTKRTSHLALGGVSQPASEQLQVHRYLMVRDSKTLDPPIERRPKQEWTETFMEMAFKLPTHTHSSGGSGSGSREEPVEHLAYAYLPMKKYGLRFLLNVSLRRPARTTPADIPCVQPRAPYATRLLFACFPQKLANVCARLATSLPLCASVPGQ